MEKTSSKKVHSQTGEGKAVASLALGIMSLTGLGLLTGIPAVILAAIALNQKTEHRSLSIAGLVTGAVGTVLSILFIGFFFLLLLTAPAQPQPGPVQYSPQSSGSGSVDQPMYFPSM